MPFLLVPLLDNAGPTTLFVVVAVAMLIVATDIGVLGPRTTGVTLDSTVDPAAAPAGDPVPAGTPLSD